MRNVEERESKPGNPAVLPGKIRRRVGIPRTAHAVGQSLRYLRKILPVLKS